MLVEVGNVVCTACALGEAPVDTLVAPLTTAAKSAFLLLNLRTIRLDLGAGRTGEARDTTGETREITGDCFFETADACFFVTVGDCFRGFGDAALGTFPTRDFGLAARTGVA